jgi:propionate CoA-transferase
VNGRSLGAAPAVVEANGDGLLKYLPLAADVALLRGTVADVAGNISLEDEALVADVFAQASHCHCRGGKVFVQVRRVQQEPLATIDIPACLVDGVVVATLEHHWQNFSSPDTSPSLRFPASEKDSVKPVWPALPAGWRRAVASRAALELRSGETVNLGLGAPERIAQVLDEAGLLGGITLSTEAGTIGGRPASGLLFGAATHPDMVVSTAALFDMYDQGFLDVTVLGMGQIDRHSVNVGRFQGRFPGVGGFPSIAIAAKRLVIFVGRHRADASPKFVEEVESVSVCLEEVQAPRILIVTERCVLEWRKDGVALLEVAPGETVESVASSIPWQIEVEGCEQMAGEVFRAPFAP